MAVVRSRTASAGLPTRENRFSQNDAVEKGADIKRHLFCRSKCEITQRGIESLKGESPKRVIKEFLLPEGEGQDEGEPRSITDRRVTFTRNENRPQLHAASCPIRKQI
jgi:hypothetical protein